MLIFDIKMGFIHATVILCFLTGVHSELEIVKWWNGVTTEDEIGVIAIQANGPIDACVWTHYDTDKEISSEDRNRDVEIIINNDEYICKLRVKKAKIDVHDGLWNVEVTGACNEGQRPGRRQNSHHKQRTKRQITAFPISTIDTGTPRKSSRHRSNPTFRRNYGNSHQKSSRIRSDCHVSTYLEDVEFLVARNNRDEMKIIAGEVEVYGTKDEVAILTARTSIKPKKYVLSSALKSPKQ
jgi:hypothetical protein